MTSKGGRPAKGGRVVSIDDEETWPNDLREQLEHHLDSLRKYFHEEGRLLKLYLSGDVMARSSAPPNAHCATWQEATATARKALLGLDVIGFHCTRLHNRGIDSVLARGLEPLSPEGLDERIREVERDGDLDTAVAERLRRINQAADSNRAGMIWFVFSAESLREEGGLYRLFRSWGGEALYNSHEVDPQLGRMLRRIGIPCIIEVCVPFDGLNGDANAHERFVRRYLRNRGVEVNGDDSFEGFVRERVEVQRIRRVIRRSEPDFAQLTNCDRWSEEIG